MFFPSSKLDGFPASMTCNHQDSRRAVSYPPIFQLSDASDRSVSSSAQANSRGQVCCGFSPTLTHRILQTVPPRRTPNVMDFKMSQTLGLPDRAPPPQTLHAMKFKMSQTLSVPVGAPPPQTSKPADSQRSQSISVPCSSCIGIERQFCTRHAPRTRMIPPKRSDGNHTTRSLSQSAKFYWNGKRQLSVLDSNNHFQRDVELVGVKLPCDLFVNGMQYVHNPPVGPPRKNYQTCGVVRGIELDGVKECAEDGFICSAGGENVVPDERNSIVTVVEKQDGDFCDSVRPPESSDPESSRPKTPKSPLKDTQTESQVNDVNLLNSFSKEAETHANGIEQVTDEKLDDKRPLLSLKSSARKVQSKDDIESGDLIMIGPLVRGEFRNCKAVVTHVQDDHCTAAVLDEDLCRGIGETWPNFSDIVILSSHWRVGTEVIISSIMNAKNRKFNGTEGVIVVHPKKGHPCFMQKGTGHNPNLVLCVKVCLDGVSTSLMLRPACLVKRDVYFAALTNNLCNIVPQVKAEL